MNGRRRSSVRPRISLADVNYNHKSVLASLRAAISMTTVLLARILDASIDHNDVIHCAQGPHQCTEENLDPALDCFVNRINQEPRRFAYASTSDILQ
jgi:hypothetical protein